MAARLGGQQISALLESLPGIASVLRSPVADAIVGMIRAGAGLGEFHESDVKELVQYAVRRGLLGSQEGEELLAEVREAAKELRRAKRAAKKTGPKKSVKKATRKPPAKTKPKASSARSVAKKTPKAGPAKAAAKTTTKAGSATQAKKPATRKAVGKTATKKAKETKATTKRAPARRRKG